MTAAADVETNVVDVEERQLRASLQAHNAAFEALLRLIPPKYYLSSVEEDEGLVVRHLLPCYFTPTDDVNMTDCELRTTNRVYVFVCIRRVPGAVLRYAV